MAIYGPSLPGAADSSAPAMSDHSLAQTWTTGNSAQGLQTVETGWNVDRLLYSGSAAPHLFVYSTADGYAKTGCYNDWDSPGTSSCVPWVQTSRLYAPGMALAPNAATPGAPPSELFVRTAVDAGGNWWVQARVGNQALDYIGFYAGNTFKAPMTYFSIGGEVYDRTGTFTDPSLQMGSGSPASDGPGLAAYHRDYSAFVAAGDGGPSVEISSASVCSTRPASYAYAATPPPGNGAWQQYFYYGRAGTPPSAPEPPDASVALDASE